MKEEGKTVPPVVLVFSFRDQEPEVVDSGGDYAKELLRLADLTDVVALLREATSVKFASGSLASPESARSLLDEIGKAL